MDKKIQFFRFILIILLGSLLAGEGHVNAQTVDFSLMRSTLSSCAGTVSENDISITNTLGQPFVGSSFSGDYQIGSGFWTSLIKQISDFFFIFLPLLQR